MMRWRTEEVDYQRLLQRVAAVDVPRHPQGFLFWMRHTPATSAWELWMLCPRVEWMLWIAELCGVSEWRREALRAGVEGATAKWRKADDGEAATPNVDGAALAHQLMSWSECAGALLVARAVA